MFHCTVGAWLFPLCRQNSLYRDIVPRDFLCFSFPRPYQEVTEWNEEAMYPEYRRRAGSSGGAQGQDGHQPGHRPLFPLPLPQIPVPRERAGFALIPSLLHTCYPLKFLSDLCISTKHHQVLVQIYFQDKSFYYFF